MDKILKNSWIFIILILLLLFKENIYKIFYPQQYEFNYLKENELNYYKNEYLKVLDKYDIKDFSANDYIYSKVIYRNIYDFYNKLFLLGDYSSNILRIDKLKEITSNLTNLDYDIYKYSEYLENIIESGMKIEYNVTESSNNTVKIMTIHASKGLEYPVCYFTGLSKKFNIDDLKNKFYYDNTLGFITPYVKNGIHSTVVKLMLKNKYILEEISERLRLFYVALTRAREKMIIVGEFDKNELAYKVEGVVDRETRSSYRKFTDMLDSIYDYLKPYIKDIDIDSLGLTKDYNLSVKKDLVALKNEKGNVISVEEYTSDMKKIENSHFSKITTALRTKEEQKNIDFGLRMHYLFEITDFNNPDYNDFNAFEVNCIQKFINTGILNDSKEIYKEYEFIYENAGLESHGIIDLLIIKKDKAIIVDYKLKHITDTAYLKQLAGYKNYILEMTNLPVDVYLYSIMDSNLVNLNI